MRKILVYILLGFCATLAAQENRSYILSQTNVKKLKAYSVDLSKEAEMERKAIRLASSKSINKSAYRTLPNGTIVYMEDDNKVAAIANKTTELYSGGSLGLDLDGNSFVIGQWERGNPLSTHEMFVPGAGQPSRVSVLSSSPNINSHATHVAGTLIGDGIRNNGSVADTVQGMAPAASLQSYSRDTDNADMATFAAAGNLISNHSYGDKSGYNFVSRNGNTNFYKWYGNITLWDNGSPSELFGLYDSKSRTWDSISYLAPFYLIVKSAGNERNDNPNPFIDRVKHSSEDSYSIFDPNSHPGGDGIIKSGYDSNRTFGTIKNGLVVGAIDGRPGNNNAIANFTSWGPTDDGRMKPDIVSHGVSVWSAHNTINTSYTLKSGTSMATPAVAGTAILLQEYYEDLNGSGMFMRSATLKALLMHTASDLDNDGPDYKTGYGLINAEKAANIIKASNENTNARIVENVHNESMYSIGLVSTCQDTTVVTMAYTDPPGIAQTTLDNSTPNLVNDLDVRLFNVNNIDRPWVLNPASPDNLATKGDNDLDNVEQVVSSNQNIQLLQVSNEGSLYSGSQNYSLVISGIENVCIEASQATGLHSNGDILCNYLNSTFESDATVNAPNDVTYYARSIRLTSGFTAKHGSKFRAIIKPICN